MLDEALRLGKYSLWVKTRPMSFLTVNFRLPGPHGNPKPWS
jgi:hypothetical protein